MNRKQSADPRAAIAAYGNIFAVMLYSEDAVAQNHYRHAVADEISLQFPDTVRLELLAKLPRHSAHMQVYRKEVEDFKRKAAYSRKSGMLGAKNVEGCLVGKILCHMLNPKIGSLDNAYRELRRRFQSTNEFANEACDILLPGERLAVPSVSKLKEIWANYKNVSHFWAADYTLGPSMDALSLSAINQPYFSNAPEILSLFLGVSMFFRSKLVEANAPYQKTPYISNEQLPFVWTVLTEDGRPFPAINCVLR